MTELTALAEEIRHLRERAEKAEANYAFMVNRAANEKLDGYRELGARAASAENEADRLRSRLRETAQILIAEVGADGPMDAEDAARKAVERMTLLRTLADEKAAEAGLCVPPVSDRESIVAFLRREYESGPWQGTTVFMILADAIERAVDREKA